MTEINQNYSNKLAKILSSKITLIDVGANSGDFIFLIKSIVAQSSFYGIEPNPLRFKELHHNCLQWEEGTNHKIYALNIAIGDRDGQADFYYNISDNGKSFLKPNREQDRVVETLSGEKVTVDLYKLDTLFKSMKPDLININPQGSELEILQGSTEILKLGKTKFLIASKSSSFAEVEKFMNSFGYQSTVFDEISLFQNYKKDNRYQNSVENLRRFGGQIIPASWRYQIRKLMKK
jgi:FkbM family methyltransferase